MRGRGLLQSVALFVAGFTASSAGMSIHRALVQSVSGEVRETLVSEALPVASDAVQFQLHGGNHTWDSPRFGDISVMNGIDLESCRYSQVPNDLFVPIFIMTRDRISSLQKSLKSYWDTIQSPYEIIILDHHSTFPPTVEYLHHLATTQNVTVVPLLQEAWDAALEEASQFIQDYLERHPSVSFYVYTDPDIAFLRTAPDVLLYYAGLLSSCPEYRVVGPALQISDIPSHFSKKYFSSRNFFKKIFYQKSVYEWESMFWTDVPNIATWNGIGYHVASQPIDTTFGMFRRDTQFKRLLRPSLRAYAPYAAVHVDWYDDSKHLPEDKVYYSERQLGVNNW